jgi:hypothetical protein
MGQEYQLKKLYESLLKGEKAEEKQSKQPRTLSEAYQQKLVSERTVFFAKDNNEYTTLGVVEDPEEANDIKNNIKSFSILSTTDSMLEQANWDKNNPILSSRKLGSLLLQKQIDILDLNKLQQNKESLTELENNIINGAKFNMIDVLIKGIQSVLTDSQKTSNENFKSLIDNLIVQRGRIDGTDVGPGEVAITLFSNAIKPNKGDLNFNGKIVEAKASSYGKEKELSGAALGYTKYSSGGALEKAMSELLKTKSVSPNRLLYKIKKKYDEMVETMQESSSLLPFTNLFFRDLTQLSKLIVDQEFDKIKDVLLNKFGLDLNIQRITNSQIRDTINLLMNNNYLDKSKITQETLSNPKSDVYLGLKQIIFAPSGIFGKLRQIFKVDVPKLSNSSQKELDVQDKNTSLTVAFGDFFFSDLGFSPQQLATVFIEARPHKEHRESLLSDLESALSNGYAKRLQRQDSAALKGLLFALHLSEYARAEEFQYLLLFNYTTGNAISIPVQTSFEDLLKFYENHKQEMDFRIDFIGRQGAHKLALR